MASGRQPPTDASRREFFDLSLQFDDPAFLRRARGVEQDWEDLVRSLERKQMELLEIAILRLGILAALIGNDWRCLKVITDTDAVKRLAKWHEHWAPQLGSAVTATRSRPRWRRAVRELNVSLDRFNRHWAPYIESLDLSRLNQAREDYNRYYIIEKSAAFQSEAIGRLDFSPLPPITHVALLQQYPLLESISVR